MDQGRVPAVAMEALLDDSGRQNGNSTLQSEAEHMFVRPQLHCLPCCMWHCPTKAVSVGVTDLKHVLSMLQYYTLDKNGLICVHKQTWDNMTSFQAIRIALKPTTGKKP